MASYRDIWPEILVDVRGSPNPALLWERCVRVMREWAYKTLAWQERLSPITLVSGTPDYALTPGAGLEVAALLGAVSQSGRDIDALAYADIQRRTYTTVIDRGSEVAAVYCRDYDTTRVWCYPAPHNMPVGATITPLIAVQPAAGATSSPAAVPDRIFSMCREALIDGVKAELYLMKDVPWESGPKYAEHRERFKEAIAVRALDVQKGGQRGPIVAEVSQYGGMPL